jgi:tetratricopeptide (TPR) repeat protein
MKTLVIFVCGLVIYFKPALAQEERKLIREGIREYEKQKYSDAEIAFRKAHDKNEKSFPADFNTANSLYKQKKFQEAASEYQDLQKKGPDNDRMADLYHNIGNSFFEQQQYDKSIEAYKNSLKLRPSDENTRYNLAYALMKLREQQQNKQDDKSDRNNQDDQKKEDQQSKQNQDKNEQSKNDQELPREKNNITKQEAEQILQAIQNQEKEVNEKVEKNKTKAARDSNLKDW